MRKHLKTVTLLLLTACILWWLWRGLNWSDVRHSFSQANALLVGIALGISCVTNLLRAFRWRALLSPLASADIHDVFAATNIGIGSSFLFGVAVGELVRPLALPLLSGQVRRAASFLTIMVERAYDISVLAVLFGLTLLWLPTFKDRPMANAHFPEIGMILLISPALAVGILVLLKGRILKTHNWITYNTSSWHFAPISLRRAASGLLQQLMVAFRVLANMRALVIVIFWTAVQWLSVILTNWLILRAFGLSFGAKETILVMCCGFIGSFVPTPGGAAGPFHAAISSGLIFLGVTLGQAAAISITLHLIGFIPALGFGSYYLLRCGVNLAQLQHEVAAAAD